MKARLSLITAIAVTALAFFVPAVLADPGLDGAPELVDSVSYFHANELATAAASSPTPGSHVDAIAYFHANELATAAASSPISAPYVDAFERLPTTSIQASESTVEDSGLNIAWGQIALSFVTGLLLAVGLMLAGRARPSRTLAH